MHWVVGLIAALAGAAATPLVLAAARVAPRVGRRQRDAGSPAPDESAPPGAIDPREISRRSPTSAAGHRMSIGATTSVAVVATANAAVLGLLGARVGLDPALPAYAVFGLVAVTLVLVDLAEHRLPDVLTLPSYLVGTALLALAVALGSATGSLGRAALSALVALAVFALLWVVAPSGIGLGDVKYAGVVGLHAGWLGWGALVVALVGGFVVGGLVSLALLATGRVGLRSRVPFGPSMIAGALVGIVVGEPIARAWLAW